MIEKFQSNGNPLMKQKDIKLSKSGITRTNQLIKLCTKYASIPQVTRNKFSA